MANRERTENTTADEGDCGMFASTFAEYICHGAFISLARYALLQAQDGVWDLHLQAPHVISTKQNQIFPVMSARICVPNILLIDLKLRREIGYQDEWIKMSEGNWVDIL